MLAHLTREFHPLRFSQVAPFACDGSRPIKAVSTLGLRLDNRISPICGSSPPSQPRLVCARKAAPPYTSSLKLGSWPAQSRTAFLSGAYRMYPIDLFNSRTVASPHRCTVADTFVPNGGSVEICLKLSHISGDRQKRKAAAPPFSLSFPALWGRVWKGKPCVPFLVCGGLEPIAKRVPSFCYFLA